MPPQQSIPIRRARGQLPGKEVLPSGVPRKLLTFGFFLFLSTLLVYVGLSAGYRSFLESEISVLEENIDELRFTIDIDEQENLVRFFSQINNVKEILDNHVITSSLFPILEANTHSRVAYTGIEIAVVERRVTIEGIAESFDALVSQLTIYEAAPPIERVILESAERSGSVVNFKISLTFVPEVFRFVEL